jgi:hypothetical protein
MIDSWAWQIFICCRTAGHSLADFLAEALARDAVDLALTACELLRFAYALAVGVAQAQASERVALRQAVLLLHDHPGRRCLCTPHTRRIYIHSIILAKLDTPAMNWWRRSITCRDDDEKDDEEWCGHAARQCHLSPFFCLLSTRKQNHGVSSEFWCNRRSYGVEWYMEAHMTWWWASAKISHCLIWERRYI